jgi:FkbM family methyltransferase
LQILQLLSAFGPRFDELELKIRPLFRFDDGAWAVRFADGYVLAPGEDPTFALMLTNATSAGFEPGLRAVLSRLVEPGMRVADVGANIGLISLALARLCGPSGQVHSFEPEPKFRALLERTLALNGLSWVKLSPFAAGRAVAKTTFHVSTIPGHSSLYPLPNEETAHDRAFAVDVAPLDAVLGTDAPLDVVKIDVEGAELDVLAGMSAILAANADIALLAEFGPSHLRRIGISPREWFDAFAAEGFDAFEILEPSGAVRPADVSYLQDVSSANIAFARPGGRAHAKIVGAS